MKALMNEIVKENIQRKLIEAMDKESLKPGQAAKFLNIIPSYISMIKNKGQWDKCPKAAWETVLLWVNTGESMKEYAEKHTEFLEKINPKKEKEITKEIVIPFQTQKLINLLKAEKLLLEKQISAIDVLLECYSNTF